MVSALYVRTVGKQYMGYRLVSLLLSNVNTVYHIQLADLYVYAHPMDGCG